jgi:actin-related protein
MEVKIEEKNKKVNSINCNNNTSNEDEDLKTIINIDYDGNSIQLTNKSNNGDNKENYCLVCLDNIEIKDLENYKIECGHKFCKDCWLNYLKEKINSNEDILCMEKTCLKNIKDERIRCPEGLFKSSLIGKEDFDIGKICNDLIKKYKENEQKILYNSIVLSGGNSMFNGLPERLTREIKSLAPDSMKEEVQVIASPGRNCSAIKGGSILSIIDTFKNKWITKAEYEESGPDIVYKKCIKSL